MKITTPKVRITLMYLHLAARIRSAFSKFYTSASSGHFGSRIASVLILVCIHAVVQGQTNKIFTTSGNSNDWNNAAAWTGGAVPPTTFNGGVQVYVNHDLTYDGQTMTIRNGSIEVSSGVSLMMMIPNLKFESGTSLKIGSRGRMYVTGDPGNFSSDGTMILESGAYFECAGNFINNGILTLSNSCLRMTLKNFTNSGQVQGDGNVDIKQGSLTNDGSWSADVKYCANGNINGSFPTPEACANIDALCDCLKDPSCNPDILPGYLALGDIVSPGLIALAEGNVNDSLKNDLFILGAGSKVVIDINFKDRAAVDPILAKYSNVGPIIYDGSTAVVPSNVLTLFFPIAYLTDLDTTPAHKTAINSVSQTFPTQGRSIRNVEEIGNPSTSGGGNATVTGSSLPNQGDFAQESFFTRAGYNLSGANVHMGIFSDSYDNGGNGSPTQDIADGILPNDIMVHDMSPEIGQGIDEGRAMLQIVHSVAPGAQLFFNTGFEGPGSMAESIIKLAGSGYDCKVMVDDITHPAQPFFDVGLVGQAIQQVKVDYDVAYFTSAGNFAERAWADTYQDLGGRHDFGGGNILQKVNLGIGPYFIVLQWEEDFYSIPGSQGPADVVSGQGAQSDFDIFLADDNGNPIYNFSRNNKGDDPVEILPFYVVKSTSSNIVIQRKSGTGSPRLKYIVYKAGDKNQGFSLVDASKYGKGTITAHARSSAALTVGAVRYDNTPTYGGTLQTQGFSSRGDAGMNKPDFTAVNGGNISFDLGGGDYAGDSDNLPNFFGTSSSAPHAAAVAALLLEAKDKFSLTYDVPTVMKTKAINYGEPSIAMGAGFLSAYNSLLGFANPSPAITRLDLTGFEGSPEDGGMLVIEGEYFVDGSTKVYLRDQLLTPTEFTDSSITVDIPPYSGGNPAIWVLNTSLADGDGGADTAYFSDPIITPVDIIANDTTKRFGEELPTFTFRTEPALSPTEMSLLAPYVEFSTNATALTDAESFPSVTPYLTVPAEDLPPELIELYEFTPVPGNMYVAPMELKIIPQDFTVQYGSAIRDQIDYVLEFGTPQRPANINAANLNTLKNGILSDYKASQANDLLILTDISLSNISLSNISLSNFISLSNISLSNISLSNLLQGKSFMTSFKTLKNISLSNISLSNISLSNISLSNTINSGAVPIDISLFDQSNQWDGGTEFGNTYSSLPNISLSNISLSNFISLSNAQVGASQLNISLSNISLSNISLSNFTSLSNISLSNISLSNISLSNFTSLSNISQITNISLSNGDIVSDYNDANFRNFISLSNNDNTEILSIFEESEAQETYDSIIPLFPINFISGVGAGDQIVAPATFMSEQYSKNFIVTYGLGNAQITEAEINIHTHDTTAVYGDSLPEFRISIDGLQYLDQLENVLERIDLINQQTGLPYDGSAGTYDIVPVINNGNYQVINSTIGTFTVEKATLTVTADNQTKVYGASNPELTFQYSGWVNGVETIDVAPITSTIVSESSLVGSYPGSISLAGGSDNNYIFSFIAGDFTVTKAVLIATADPQTKVYGSPNPPLTFQYSGWVNGVETIDAEPSPITTIDETTMVGSYPGSITLTGGSDNNYTLSFVSGDFTVTKAVLIARADNQTKVYGASNPPLSFHYSGWVNGVETIDVAPIASTTIDEMTIVGSYPGSITLTGGSDNNYSLNLIGADFTITKAVLTVTADNQTKLYGTPNPTLTFQYNGWINGVETIDVAPSTSTIVGGSTIVGSYPGSISVAGGSDNNYTFSYIAGNFTVTKAVLIATADPQTKVYGSPNPTLTFQYSGWVNGVETIDVPPTVSTTVTFNTNAGNYPGAITLSGGLDNNYTLSLISGDFAVTKASLLAKADNKSRIYGLNNPPLTITYSGFVNGESVSSINPPLVSTVATCSSGVNTSGYVISLSGGLATNYEISRQNGTLTITKAPITIYADNKVVLEGASQPQYTFKAVGSVCGNTYTESIANETLIKGVLDRPYGAAGVYTITPQVLAYNPANYYIAGVVAGTLYVNPIVGCNMKISATDLCKIPMTPVVIDGITYTDKLRFEYTNPSAVPIYIALGPNNGYKTKGQIRIIGDPPVVFMPGVHTWEVITTGNDIQWEITTPGCNNFSKSPNGSNANECTGSTIGADIGITNDALSTNSADMVVYPNPFNQRFTLDISSDLIGFADKNLTIGVYDAIGRLINVLVTEQIPGQRFEIDMKDLQAGVYLVKVQNNKENRIFKLLKR